MSTWLLPLLGGLLIGLASALYLLALGRVLGISGILSQALFMPSRRVMAMTFIVGLIIGGSTYGLWYPPATALPETRPSWLLIISGLLVGYGTKLGSGCTSGHGVCGLSRFARRSIIATCIFIASAITTVAVLF